MLIYFFPRFFEKKFSLNTVHFGSEFERWAKLKSFKCNVASKTILVLFYDLVLLLREIIKIRIYKNIIISHEHSKWAAPNLDLDSWFEKKKQCFEIMIFRIKENKELEPRLKRLKSALHLSYVLVYQNRTFGCYLAIGPSHQFQIGSFGFYLK